jgi:hypothetical protein
VGGSGTGPGDQKSLEAVLTVPDPSELIPGKPFDFELLVTNRGKKTVVIPQSLDWDDVNSGGPDWRYRVANVVLQVAPDGGHQRGHIDLGLQFYGSDEKPLTELVLAPGDGVRIFGTGQLPVSMNINGYPILKGKLSGSFLDTYRVASYGSNCNCPRRIQVGWAHNFFRRVGAEISGKPPVGAIRYLIIRD